ncbi:hypothetical protein [Salinimicrobium sp. TH3]|uniref:hypothetical protein n=1 Tax=Salinimicrobium sp. TH3 TaxID=2997342 RepID=UPI002273EAE9|nr:hypothetical protein [Salinimicrobium sp. TH3]MCY2688743.1 hypothetical protein [Salinimicrobium sp. TH3]
MDGIKNLLKKMLFPVTPVVVLAGIFFFIFLWAVIEIFSTTQASAFLAAIAIPISLFVFVLYGIERFIVRKINYRILFVGELILLLILPISFYYSVSMTDLNVTTEKSYFVVLFDSKENSLTDFKRTGLFGKELSVSHHIIHLDSSLYNNEALRIRVPETWREISNSHGQIKLSGKKINYRLYSTEENLNLTVDELLGELERETSEK